MNRNLKTPLRTKGIALVATLMLLTIIGLMMAQVIRGNVAQRRYLKQRRSQTAALYMAEAGVSEALHAIARQGGQTALDRADGDGKFHVQWIEEQPGSRTYEIRSVGIHGTNDLATTRRAVKVRALMLPGQQARILSWESTAAGT